MFPKMAQVMMTAEWDVACIYDKRRPHIYKLGT